MNCRGIIGSLMFMSLVAGCGVTPKPGMSAAVLEISARPRPGLEDRFQHVAVYDSGPDEMPAGGPYEEVNYSSLADIIVWLEPAPVTASPGAPLTIGIDVRHPSSNVHPASVGQQIIFQNFSSKPVSLYSVSDANDFQLPPIAPGGQGTYTARGEGLIEVLSDPSQPPAALIYAAPSPWVARTRSGKTVVFNDLPPGAYKAISWHPRLPGSSADVKLSPDRVTHSTLVIGVGNLASFQR